MRKLREAEVYGALKLNQAKRPHTRSDNGPESTAQCDRMRELGVNTLFIEPGSPWENGLSRASTAGSGTSCSTGRSSNTLKEAEVLVERWRQLRNQVRPHSSLGDRTPTEFARGWQREASERRI